MRGRPIRERPIYVWRNLALCLLLLASAACAQRLAPPGPGPTEPALSPVPTQIPAPAQINADQIETPETDAPKSEPETPLGSFTTSDGLELPLRAWLPEGPPRAVILALHGFNDYSRAFEEPGHVWAASGLAVYAYDQRGFGAGPNPGLWPGTEALVKDVATATALLRDRYPGVPLFLLGESMGGAVVVAAETRRDPPRADGVILSAPAVWASWTQPWYQRTALWIALKLTPGFRPEPSGLGVQASDNIEMLRDLGRDPLFIKRSRIDALAGLVDLMGEALQAAPRLDRPTLVLYGEKDEIVPAEPLREFWRNLPKDSARLAVYPEGWHLLLRDLGAARPIGDAEAWILDPEAPLPSGAEAGAEHFAGLTAPGLMGCSPCSATATPASGCPC